jgi:hypothetical protein
MPPDLPIRILPMSDRIPGFRNRSIPDIQQNCFLRDLPSRGGRYRYARTGLSAPPGTLVLFQFQSRIIASAIFLRDEKFPRPRPAKTRAHTATRAQVATRPHAGILHFDPASFQIFHPLDLPTMRKIWPTFRAFGHVKHRLNPDALPFLKKHLKPIQPKPPRKPNKK